jgi:predicted ATPase
MKECVQALETAERESISRDQMWRAGTLHLKGEALSAQGESAESCFRAALDIARAQQAKSLELRAAVSLARLLQEQQRLDEARGLLAPLYGWFTEGLDTPDLKDAKALLATLA